MSSNTSGSILQIANLSSAVSVATTLSATQSGGIIPLALNGAAAFALTLPAPQLGLNYRLVVATAGTRNCTVTPNGGTFNGYLIGAATPVACAAKGTIVMTAANLLAGDSLFIYSDGAGWIAQGFCQTAAGFA